MEEKMILLEGKTIAQNILKKIAEETKDLTYPPRLDIFLLGDDFASNKYVQIKEKTAKEVGIKTVVHKYDSSITQEAIITQIEDLGGNPDVDGIIVQLPLPEGLNVNRVVNAINLKKDVDGLSAQSIGRTFVLGKYTVLPATVQAIKEILNGYKINVEGENAVVIGASREVGIPTAGLMLSLGATVTICHDKTKNLKAITETADILISATGKAGLVTADMVKAGATVIDVGFSLVDGKIAGDVDSESVSQKAGAISPVPGGVGPVTVACLLANTLDSYKQYRNV